MPGGRHRHAINVRADGLSTVLGPLMRDAAVQAALLVDIDSGMVLDCCGRESAGTVVDQEQLGAAHGDLMRLALGPAFGPGADDPGRPEPECEIVIGLDERRHLVLRRVRDPHGDRLALSVLIDGPPRVLRRTRRRLRDVSAAALTAGPTTSLRPIEGEWHPGALPSPPPAPAPPRPAVAPMRVPAPAVPALSMVPVVPRFLQTTRIPDPAAAPDPATGAAPKPGATMPAIPAPTRSSDPTSANPATFATARPVSPAAAQQLIPLRPPAPPSALPPPHQRDAPDE